MPVSPNDKITEQLKDLRVLVKKIMDISTERALINWDIETKNLSEEEVDKKADEDASLAEASHNLTVSDEMKGYIDFLSPRKNELDRLNQALVREWKKTFDESTRLPVDFVKEQAELYTRASIIWAKARKENKYEDFAPTLEKIIDISRREAAYLNPDKNPYDVMLDKYEPNMTEEKLEEIFSNLKAKLVPIVDIITKNSEETEYDFLKRPVSQEKMDEFSRMLLNDMGFDFSRGMVAKSAHPFTTSIVTPDDIRLTTRKYENPVFEDALEDIFSTLHEGGHALAEQGISEDLRFTGIADFSLGLHESQSRLWENIVGRSRHFWNHYFPLLVKIFPEQLNDINFDVFFKAVNKVEAGLIRIQADEVTYNLHIILRYELEKSIINPEIEISKIVKSLPESWNLKMREFLGVIPETNSNGVLQDVHWSFGSIGYFPTYTLGNIASVQIYEAAKRDIPDLETKIGNGELLPLKNWLNEKIHKNGKIEDFDQILNRVTGESLNPEYFINYLQNKYYEIYGI